MMASRRLPARDDGQLAGGAVFALVEPDGVAVGVGDHGVEASRGIAGLVENGGSGVAGFLEGGVDIVDGEGHEYPGRVQTHVGGGDGEGGGAGLEFTPVVVVDSGWREAEYVAVEAGRLFDVGRERPDEVDSLYLNFEIPRGF
jgi:hypothetical protein